MVATSKFPYRPRKAIKKKTTTKMVKKPSTTFNKRVLQVVDRTRETKMKIFDCFTSEEIHGFGMKTQGSTVQGIKINNLLSKAALAQGTEQEQRIGNEVSNARLKLRGFIHSNTYDSATNNSTLPFEVHMVVYKRKKSIDNTFDIIKSLPSNSTGEIDGTLMNTLYPFNKDSYIIKKHRVFRMRPLSHEDSTGPINPQSSNAPMFQRFIQEINISNKLMYSDTLTVPSNDWVGVLFYCINGDGESGGSASGQIRAKVTMDAVLTYKDA
jgi:hypothetical protein